MLKSQATDATSSGRSCFLNRSYLHLYFPSLILPLLCCAAYARTLQAAAAEGMVPLPYLHKNMTRWNTPVPAIIVMAISTAALGVLDFEQIVSASRYVEMASTRWLCAMSLFISHVTNMPLPFNHLRPRLFVFLFFLQVVIDSCFFVLANMVIKAGFLRLRYTEPDLVRPYRFPGGMVGAWGAVLCTEGIAVFSIYAVSDGDPVSMAIVAGSVVLLTALSFVWYRFYGRHYTKFGDIRALTSSSFDEEDGDDELGLDPDEFPSPIARGGGGFQTATASYQTSGGGSGVKGGSKNNSKTATAKHASGSSKGGKNSKKGGNGTKKSGLWSPNGTRSSAESTSDSEVSEDDDILGPDGVGWSPATSRQWQAVLREGSFAPGAFQMPPLKEGTWR